MRNSSKLLALGLVLFLGACSLSAEDTAFLDRVKGKTAYVEATYDTKIGVFNSNGKEFAVEGAPEAAVFSKTTDANTAEYTLHGSPLTIMTTDGKTGTMHSISTENIFLK